MPTLRQAKRHTRGTQYNLTPAEQIAMDTMGDAPQQQLTIGADAPPSAFFGGGGQFAASLSPTARPEAETAIAGRSTTFRSGYSTPTSQPQRTEQVTTATSKFTPSGAPKPEFEAPDFVPVEFDKKRLAALRQQKAAPFRKTITRELQRAFTGSYKDKPSRDIAIRNSLREYGQAYGQILVQAEAAARSELEQETAQLKQERYLEFQAAMTQASLEFQTAWDAWLKAGTTTTTQQSVQVSGAGGEGGKGFFKPYVRATNVMGRETRQLL